MRVLPTFIAASGLTNLADGIATVAWAWLASYLTRDPFLIALIPVALRLPWFLFAIPAGVITDRVDRRRLILWMDMLRALGFVAVAVSVILAMPLAEAPAEGVSSVPLFALLLAAALVVGGAEVFRDNAAQTMMPALVPPEQLEQANGRLWSVELIGNALLGPAVGAFLIAAYLPLPFAANALAYGIAILLVLRISGNFRPEPGERNWRRELAEGWNFLKASPLLRTLALITGVWNLLFHMVLIGLILHAQENLSLGAQAYGLVLAGGAIGGVLGGWVGGNIVVRLGQARAAQWMLAASAPAFLGIALAPGPIALALVLAVFEFTGVVWNTVSVSYRQRAIPDRLLGRVNSLYRLLAWGMMPIGLLLSGVLVNLAENLWSRPVALTTPFYVATAAAALLVLVGWRPIGRGFGKDKA
ncbi:MFS transporter [Halovulum sp. GXIMD14793]